MDEEGKLKIISENYVDIIIDYEASAERLKVFENDTINFINERYAVIHFDVKRTTRALLYEAGYAVVPNLYGLTDTANLVEMGVKKLQSIPALSLRGDGVLLGFVDTGIDYTNEVFKNQDGTTRIVSIWDQTIVNMQASEEIFYFGTEYTSDMINQALSSEDPYSTVQSVDENGHGTTLAGLVGGSVNTDTDFVGVAPDAQFIVVKLKPAKAPLKDFLCVAPDIQCYQENDIMFAIQYLFNMARKYRKPISICVGLGTNQGAHDGRSYLDQLISGIAGRLGTAIVISAGNEGNMGHHYFGIVNQTTGYDTVELKVGQDEFGFTMELWGQAPGIYSIDIISPSGEYIPRIPARLGENREVHFLFEKTVLLIDYLIVEAQTGDQLIFFRFQNPASGIWKFRVYGKGDINSGFHIWLPMRGFISDNTYFVKPDPDTTITNPGNGMLPITITAYDHRNQSLYRNASRGYSRDNIIKPELAAPGVDLFAPSLNGTFSTFSGTSISAAEATGVAAMLLEWGIVRGNYIYMDTLAVKKFLIRGVRRLPNITYPNREWGYGMIDIYRTFESLRGE
jgi:subtilisin family serine protease